MVSRSPSSDTPGVARDENPAKPASPEQAHLNGRPGAVLNSEYRTDVPAAWAEFQRQCQPAPRVVLRSTRMPPPPRRARGRAPRQARNTRTRGSRRTSRAQARAPDDPDGDGEPAKRGRPDAVVPDRHVVRPRSGRVRGGRR
jgi:hypothetical protein